MAKVTRVGRYVQGEAVHRHTTGDPHSYRRYLLSSWVHSGPPLLVRYSTDPNTGLAIYQVCRDANFGQRFDDRPLQHAHVCDGAQSNCPQINDRVANQLSRTVIGRFTAAVGLVDLDAAGSQCIERTQDVTLADPPAQRDYMWVLKKQEGIGD